MIIEDDRDASESIAIVLNHEGYITALIREGNAALARLGDPACVPDVVVLDLHIPGVHGMDILDLLKSEPRYQSTQIIIMTADVLLANKVGSHADLVCIKPFNIDELLHAIRLLST
jgi:DNA-binding response OmpR family regulator